MKNGILIITLTLLTCFELFSQTVVDKKFCKNKWGEPASDEKHAKFCEITIKEKDSTIRYEMRNIKSNELITVQAYKNDIPVGTWITTNGKELDYDFDLSYIDSGYSKIVKYNLPEIDTLKHKFDPPTFPDGNFLNYVAMRLYYPQPAVENNIQGKVITQFIIDESGNLIELSIFKSANKILDKEAARVIRQSPKWTPAKLDGHPIRIAVKIPTIFKIQQ